jgi:hypothetical protein
MEIPEIRSGKGLKSSVTPFFRKISYIFSSPCSPTNLNILIHLEGNGRGGGEEVGFGT